MRTQYFCYVYDVPEGTPLMFALDADTLPEAVRETRRMMAEDDGDARFAEIWDGSGEGVLTRIEGVPGRGLIKRLRRGRPFSRFSRP